MKAAPKVIIAIPVYRDLADDEKISLQQCLRVLGKYSIALIAPKSMDVSHYLDSWPFIVERFDDSFFTGTISYSHLLLSQEFYRRFQSYDYLLIHQLDVFVFSDRLLEFCRKGYDYIGAPVPRWGWPERRNRVGNGGCSLRKVSSCCRVLSEYPPDSFFARYRQEDNPEDFYFAGCAEQENLDFHAPSLQEALDFAVDYELFHCYRRMPGWLPFACHAWQKKPDVWKKIIEGFGYHVADHGILQESPHRKALLKYACRRLERPSKDASIAHRAIRECLCPYESLAIWGYGKDGRKWMENLQKFSLPQPVVFDQHAESVEVEILRPLPERVMSCGRFILITSRRYTEKMVERLRAYGLQEGRDFMDVNRFFDAVCMRYYQLFSHRHHKTRRKG